MLTQDKQRSRLSNPEQQRRQAACGVSKSFVSRLPNGCAPAEDRDEDTQADHVLQQPDKRRYADTRTV